MTTTPTMHAPPFPGPISQPPPQKSESVKQWQTRMKQRGWQIIADGIYGPKSERICRNFQAEKKLSVDGIVGPMTWEATWEAPTTKAPQFPGRILKQPPMMHGEDVRRWQDQMNKRGWPIEVDGDYGPKSEDICRKLQKERRLDVDGDVGPKTWAAAWTEMV